MHPCMHRYVHTDHCKPSLGFHVSIGETPKPLDPTLRVESFRKTQPAPVPEGKGTSDEVLASEGEVLLKTGLPLRNLNQVTIGFRV